MNVRYGHMYVGRVATPRAIVANGSKGGEALEEEDGIVPLGNGGRLRPPLF
jgi:hypothetical protein